jgi:hypothetical protein
MFVNPLLVMIFVTFAKTWGPGGAGAACALAAVGTELVVLTAMFIRIGNIAMDVRLAKILAKSTLACSVVFAVDRFELQPMGPVRIVVDGLLYAALVIGSGAVSVKETVAFARQLRAQRAAG